MRHTGISRLVMARADIATIQKVSGHKTAQMVMHYARVFGSHIDSAISVVEQEIPDAITPKLHTAAAEAPTGNNLAREKSSLFGQKKLVRTAGVEPALPMGKRILSPQRLPFRHVRLAQLGDGRSSRLFSSDFAQV
jgi:hypothetical protein